MDPLDALSFILVCVGIAVMGWFIYRNFRRM